MAQMGWGQEGLSAPVSPRHSRISLQKPPPRTLPCLTQGSASVLCQPPATAHTSTLYPPVSPWTHRKA